VTTGDSRRAILIKQWPSTRTSPLDASIADRFSAYRDLDDAVKSCAVPALSLIAPVNREKQQRLSPRAPRTDKFPCPELDGRSALCAGLLQQSCARPCTLQAPYHKITGDYRPAYDQFQPHLCSFSSLNINPRLWMKSPIVMVAEPSPSPQRSLALAKQNESLRRRELIGLKAIQVHSTRQRRSIKRGSVFPRG